MCSVFVAGVNVAGSSCSIDVNGNLAGSATGPVVNATAGATTVQIVATSSTGTTSFFNVIPALKISPTSGTLLSLYTANASYYYPGEKVEIIFSGVDLGASCVANSKGTCTASVWLPSGFPLATFQVVGQGNLTSSSSANFNVTPSVIYSPTTGVPGTSFTATLQGYVPSMNVIVSFPSTGTACSCTINATGACVVQCTVPRTPYSCTFIALVTAKPPINNISNASSSGYFTVLASSAVRASQAFAALFLGLLLA